MCRPVSGHRTMTAPIELSLCAGLIVGWKVAASYEHCLTQRRPYRDEINEKTVGCRSDIFGKFLRLSPEQYACGGVAVDSIISTRGQQCRDLLRTIACRVRHWFQVRHVSPIW